VDVLFYETSKRSFPASYIFFLSSYHTTALGGVTTNWSWYDIFGAFNFRFFLFLSSVRAIYCLSAYNCITHNFFCF